MSASRKKMLRREENKAAMTERQQQEMKEAKKLRLYTAIFAVAMIAVIVFVIVSSVMTSGIIERNTTALTVNDEKISAVELNYFYIDTVNNFMNTYGSYAALFGLDTSLTLGEQYYDEEAGQTWADYFLESAAESAKYSYALYQDAKANGYVLPEDVQVTIDSTIDTLEAYGALYGYDASGYIKALYGAGSNEKSFLNYLTVQYTAENYYYDTMDAMEITAEEISAKDAENPQSYSSFSYNSYYLNASKFYEGGTTDEEGTTTYSDEEKAAGVEKCKAAAEELAKCATLEELDAAIAALEINAEVEGAASTAYVDRSYSNIDSTLQEWVTDPSRTAGDIGCIEYSVTSTVEHEETEEEHEHEEVTTVYGYYVVVFNGVNENKTQLVNVRHILVPFEGGTTDSTTGTTTYSDEEKAAAQATAQELLDSFLAGDATEEAFAALANENSTDTGSNTNGGLYEDVYPGQMVTNFNDWCFDNSRMTGDTGIVESSYGYHVMYFSSYSDTTYRDYMINSDLLSEKVSQWESSIVDAAVLEIVNTSKVDTELTVSAS